VNPLIRAIFYKSVTTTYEVRPNEDETHIVTKFDYDNFALYLIQESVRHLKENNQSEAAKLLESYWTENPYI